MSLHDLAKQILDAEKSGCPEDLFGSKADGSTVAPTYKQLLAQIHPDHYFVGEPREFKLANKLLTALTGLKAAADRKVKAGTYGDKRVKPEDAKLPFSPIVLEAKGHRYTLTREWASGDLAELYVGYVGDNPLEQYLFKIVREGTNNDLLENESRILGKLYPPSAKDEKFYRFLPKLKDSFVVTGSGYQRRVNVMSWFPEHRGLDEVLRVYPTGIDWKDAIWMHKRCLHGLGFAHENKIIHGAVLPGHILIHPIDHGAKIVDWSYAVELDPAKPKIAKKGGSYYDMLKTDEFGGKHVLAISNAYRALYPPEILNRETPTPAADIYMAVKTCLAVINGNAAKPRMPDTLPKTVASLFKSCLERDPAKRPSSAWDLHETIDKILRKAVGPRKYRPFKMPNTA